MRWVFVRPRNISPYYDPEVQEPLGLECLAAFLHELGDSVLIIDSIFDRIDDVRIARRAAAFMPDMVGFTLTTAHEVASVNRVCNEYRKSQGTETVGWIAGGNFVSTEPNQALRLLPDYMILVRFEGETALNKIRNRWLSDDPGFFNIDDSADKRMIEGAPVEFLDDLPFAVRPFAHMILADGGALNIQASRGCRGNCIFCASPGMAKTGQNRWRGRSIPAIVDEIEMLLKKYDSRCFNFVDEDFLGPNSNACERGLAFSKHILRRSIKISYSIQVRPDSLSFDAIDALVDAGLSFVFMGMETDSIELLRTWNRPIVIDPWRFIKRFRDRGVEINVGVMLFHKDADLDSIQILAEKLARYGLLNYQSATNRQVAMPGSILFDQEMRSNRLSKDVAGPQSITCSDSQVEALHTDLTTTLAPLGPPSMQVLCTLPSIVARQRLHGDAHKKYRLIKSIETELNHQSMHTLLELLQYHKEKGRNKHLIKEVRQRNFKISMKCVKELAGNLPGISQEILREAIRLDAGI